MRWRCSADNCSPPSQTSCSRSASRPRVRDVGQQIGAARIADQHRGRELLQLVDQLRQRLQHREGAYRRTQPWRDRRRDLAHSFDAGDAGKVPAGGGDERITLPGRPRRCRHRAQPQAAKAQQVQRVEDRERSLVLHEDAGSPVVPELVHTR